MESAAAGSYQQVVVQDMLKGHVAGEIMSQDCVMVPPDVTIEQLVNEKILTSGRRCFPVAVYGHTEGLITLQDVRTIDRKQWGRKLVRDAMIPKENLKAVREDEDLTKVLEIMTQNDINQVPFLDEQGNVVGMISRDNMLNFINTRAELEK